MRKFWQTFKLIVGIIAICFGLAFLPEKYKKYFAYTAHYFMMDLLQYFQDVFKSQKLEKPKLKLVKDHE